MDFCGPSYLKILFAGPRYRIMLSFVPGNTVSWAPIWNYVGFRTLKLPSLRALHRILESDLMGGPELCGLYVH